MGKHFFGIEKREKKKNVVKKEETYDESIFRNGQGYDPTQKTVGDDESTTTLTYAAPNGFDPSKIGAPDEKNYVPTEEPKEEEKVAEEKPVEKENKMAETSEARTDVVTEKFNPFVPQGGVEDKYANPVYVEEKNESKPDDIPNINVGPFTTFKLLIESLLKPVTKIPINSKAIDDTADSFKLLIFSTIINVILAVIAAIVGGFFVKRYDINSGLYNTHLDFGNVINIKFIDVILISGAFTLLLTLITAIVYYFTSFFRSKGVTIGSYISLCCFAFFPLFFGIFVLYPICSIFSYFFGFFVFIMAIIYSLFSLYNGIVSMVKFENENKKIFYNLFNVGIVVLILIIILLLFFESDFNSIVNTINSM